MTVTAIPLHHALRANALFSGASGLALVALPGWWAALYRPLPAWALAALGLALLAFAALVAWTSLDPRRREPLVWLIIVGDAVWVLATPVVMIAGAAPITMAGHVVLAAVAVIVGVLAVVQWRGLGRWRGR